MIKVELDAGDERAGTRKGRGEMRLKDERWRRSKSAEEMGDGTERKRGR